MLSPFVFLPLLLFFLVLFFLTFFSSPHYIFSSDFSSFSLLTLHSSSSTLLQLSHFFYHVFYIFLFLFILHSSLSFLTPLFSSSSFYTSPSCSSLFTLHFSLFISLYYYYCYITKEIKFFIFSYISV